MLTANMKGVREMTNALKKIILEYPDRVAAAIYMEAQLIMTESKTRCPVAKDGGTLRASGNVDEPVRVGRNISVQMGYGGAAESYAIAVHEHPSDYSPPSWVTHPNDIDWTTPGTGPKFLEGPINEAEKYLLGRISDRIKFPSASLGTGFYEGM